MEQKHLEGVKPLKGLSTFNYKGKSIIFVDYSVLNTKEEALELINSSEKEYCQHPKNSVLAITNVSSLHFDTDIINAFSAAQNTALEFEKKVAVIGIKGLQKVAYNFIVALTARDKIKVFDTLEEAKDWVVID